MKTLLLTLGFGLLAVNLHAEAPAKGKGDAKGKGPGGKPPEEVIAIMKKYDKNGDRKLDESERASMTAEDKATLAKFREKMGQGKGKGKGKGKGDAK